MVVKGVGRWLPWDLWGTEGSRGVGAGRSETLLLAFVICGATQKIRACWVLSNQQGPSPRGAGGGELELFSVLIWVG